MRLAATLLIFLSLALPCGAQTGRPVPPGKTKLPPRGFIQGAPATKPVVEPAPHPEVKDTSAEQNSENGWYLSPHGTIRVLVLFAEVVYDKNPEKDPQANGAEHWPKGQLPRWKDNVFDPKPLPAPKAMVTRYYHDISLGQFTVLGDYVDHLFTLRESEYPTAANGGSANALVIKEANKLPAFRTAHGLTPADFDLWKDGAAVGLPKTPGPDDPHSYDHVMVILRNSSLTHGQGSTDPGSSGRLFGFESDTQSRFGGMNALPFEILKHEFNHLLLGGNNFHSGGGNASTFQSYFICLQGGHSMMGASSSALLTCSAWDRHRLGWRAADAPFPINVRDTKGTAINGDLDPLAGDTGFFVLRDFVTSGDALRIRLPYLSEEEFPQWMWFENHQTTTLNGSPTDRFHYETEMPCVHKAVPGIYAVLQVDREEKHGRNIFGGYADYLRAVPASGFNDYERRGDTVTYQCLWPGKIQPLVAKERWSNPLTGASELEIPVFDQNGDGSVSRSKEGIIPRVEERDGKYIDEAMFFGHARQAFRPGANELLSMHSDPALTNMLTLVSTPGRDMLKGQKPNDRTVHLAGFSLKILEQRSDGSILVRVRNNDTFVDRDVRWCADSIVLHATKGYAGHALHVSAKNTVHIDRSRTPTRLDRPETVGATTYFSKSTAFTVEPRAVVHLDADATLELSNGSTLHLMPGSELSLDAAARLVLDRSSRIIVHGDAALNASEEQLRKPTKQGLIVRVP